MSLPNKFPIELTFDDILLLPDKSYFTLEHEAEKISLKSVITKKLSIDVPIISSPMPAVTETTMAITIGRCGGLGILHPFQSFTQQLEQVHEVKKHNLIVAAAVNNLSLDGENHIKNLQKAGVNLISIETAHAHNTQTIKFIRSIKKKYKNLDISVALVVTPEGTKDLISAGADNIRVGIGGGSHCTTRLVTGVGRPQLSAISECYKIAKKYHVPIMSDTGIKYAGDLAKAIAFGASSIMIGGLLTGTDKSPGKIVYKHNKKYKYSWGMATQRAFDYKKVNLNIYHQIRHYIRNHLKRLTVDSSIFEEGTEGFIPYKGSTEVVLNNLISGLRRSMWYQGVTTIDELRNHAKIVFVSPNTIAENLPRI